MKIPLLISFVCCITIYGKAQLQLDQIMKGPGFVGVLPESPEWALDGKQIYYWKKLYWDTMILSASLYTMAIFYIVAGANHFFNESFYEKIMPSWLPYHLPLIYLSGVCEMIFVFF